MALTARQFAFYAANGCAAYVKDASAAGFNKQCLPASC
jgi:hypothetical protein